MKIALDMRKLTKDIQQIAILEKSDN